MRLTFGHRAKQKVLPNVVGLIQSSGDLTRRKGLQEETLSLSEGHQPSPPLGSDSDGKSHHGLPASQARAGTILWPLLGLHLWTVDTWNFSASIITSANSLLYIS